MRLRYFVTGAVVEGNTISNCGIYDFRFNGGGKNGEGIYLGTAPEQRGLNGAPSTDPDVIKDNIVGTTRSTHRATSASTSSKTRRPTWSRPTRARAEGPRLGRSRQPGQRQDLP